MAKVAAATIAVVSQLTKTRRSLKPQATPLQWLAMSLLTIDAVAGITAIETGNRDLGRELIYLVVVAMTPFLLWVRRTQERARLADQDCE